MTRARDIADLGGVTTRLDQVGNSDGALSNRNMIINGAMQVAQRGAGPFTNDSGGYQTVDRFQLEGTMGGSFTLQQASDAPSASGFDKSFKALAPTGFSSPSSSASAKIKTSIESQNLQQLLFGTSDAADLTISFWVKATVAGTYILEMYQDDATRHLSTSYTISSSNTWEKKTITVVGDVSGTINNDSGSGLSLNWFLAAGSNFTSGTLATTWAAVTTANRAVGQVNAVASNNDAFFITGVQMEVGPVATDFEQEEISTTLSKCQRYFQSFGNSTYTCMSYGSVVAAGIANYLLNNVVPMRATPSVSYNNLQHSDGQSGYALTSLAIATVQSDENNALLIGGQSGNNLTPFRPVRLEAANNSAGRIKLDAEL